MNQKLENTQGKIFYGMHFYPGVARYEAPDREPLTVFINEDTIRQMGPSFAARPIFVEHVADVDSDLDELRGEADGWVIESFFNQADGKTWVKFIVVSDRGLRAIERGYRLSNAYIPRLSNRGGVWNGVEYQQEVIGGEFEHLAIVQNPRYEESVIMTPDQFKTYNDEKTIELKKLSNSKDKKGEPKMKLNIFKRQKVENSADFESMLVELPASKKELSLSQVVSEYDKILNMNGYANGDHMVKVGDKDEMSVNDLVKKHLEAMNELADLKAKKDDKEEKKENEDADMDAEDPAMENEETLDTKDEGSNVGDRGGDKSLDNEDDEKKDKKDEKEKMKNTMSVEEAKKVLAKDKAEKLKNANLKVKNEESSVLSLPQDQVARGKARYGSSN